MNSANKTRNVKHTCPGCGVRVNEGGKAPHPYIGANAGCWDLYGKVLAKEFQERAYFEHHRLTVDTYSIQHPGIEERRSVQSVNIHLISLAMIFVKGLNYGYATRAMGPMIERHRESFFWLNPPETPYGTTVMEVLAAKSARDHCDLVIKWARHTWEIWGEHHPTILSYLD